MGRDAFMDYLLVLPQQLLHRCHEGTHCCLAFGDRCSPTVLSLCLVCALDTIRRLKKAGGLAEFTEESFCPGITPQLLQHRLVHDLAAHCVPIAGAAKELLRMTIGCATGMSTRGGIA